MSRPLQPATVPSETARGTRSLPLEIALAIVEAIRSADPALSASIVHFNPRADGRGEASHTLAVSHEAGGRGEVTVTPILGGYYQAECHELPAPVAALVWGAIARLDLEHDRLHGGERCGYGRGVLRAG